jgi:hypothetical protein
MPDAYLAIVSCAAIDTCRPPASAVCSPPRIQGVATEAGLDKGPGASPGGALTAAIKGCKRHSITGGPPGAWGMFSNYDIVDGIVTGCSPAVIFDAKPYIDACY